MPSSYSTSLRFELQFTGENVNLWGDKLNAALVKVDASIGGWLTKALTADYALTTANGAADEASKAMLKFTGTGAFTVTIPAVSKRYDVWNACTGILTITNGSVSVTIAPGEVAPIITDGGANISRVQSTDFGTSRITGVGNPTGAQDGATKAYVDATAFSSAGGTLPGQTGNAGKFITTDGTTASWGNALTSPTIATPTITGGTTSAPTITGGVTFSGSTKQNVTAVGSTSIDVSTAEFFTKSISANTTFTFDNATASKAQAFGLKLTITSAAVPTWPATVKWTSGVAPTLGNGTHVLGFLTFDGGTTWAGVLAAFNVS